MHGLNLNYYKLLNTILKMNNAQKTYIEEVLMCLKLILAVLCYQNGLTVCAILSLTLAIFDFICTLKYAKLATDDERKIERSTEKK